MSLKRILGNIGCTALANTMPPFGGMAANVLRGVLGLKDDAKAHEIEQALEKATPEQIVALKEAEYNFKIKLKELDVDLNKIDMQDRNSARRREMKLKDSTPSVLAFLVTLGFFGLLSSLLLIEVKNANILYAMVGSLGTAWIAIVNYYFGSSLSSSKKNELLKK